MKRSPSISVIMPAYNAARYIRQAAESVLAQSYRDFELIVVDDGSTDATASILNELARRDSRVHVYRQGNMGGSLARNAGLRLARGEFIAAMDADDVCHVDRLSVQVQFMRQNPDVACVGAPVWLTDDKGAVFGLGHVPFGHDEIVASLLHGNGTAIRHPVAMMRRWVVEDVGGYDPRFPVTEDLDLFLRMGERGRLANLATPLLWYRQHSASTNRTKFRIQQQQQRVVLAEARERRGLTGEIGAGGDIAPWRPPEAAAFEESLALAFRGRGQRVSALRHAIKRARLTGLNKGALRLIGSCVLGERLCKGVRKLRAAILA